MSPFKGSFCPLAHAFVLAVLSTLPGSLRAQENFIVTGADWKYWDLGSEPVQDFFPWTDTIYDDFDWSFGPSPLGFGEPYIVTQLDAGIRAAYFRRSFDLPFENMPVTPVTLRVRRDDGIIVYLNGIEILRDNMRDGPVDYTTPADEAIEAVSYLSATVDEFNFLEGKNVIAAEVHQAAGFSSDLVFDLQLGVSNAPPRPTIRITSPLNNTFVRIGSDVAITAEATPEEDVERVEFYQGDTLLGQDSSKPYGIVWSQVPEGTHFLKAVAEMSDSSRVQSPLVQLTAVNNLLPSVTITSPANNSVLPPGEITIEASASDPDGTVTLVEFFLDGIKIGQDTNAPYSAVATLTDGDHVLSANVTDNDGSGRNSPNVFVRVGGSIGIVRGPYLQSGTPTSVIVKWRTQVSFDSVVRYGLTADNLNQSAHVPGLATDHEVPLTGLSPDTKYYYSVGSSAATQAAGPDYFFITSPPGPKPTRIWVIGDSGTAAVGAMGSLAVRDAYYAYTESRYTDLWLMLGDNAYFSGTDHEYQLGMFDVYPDLLRQTVVWSTIGNHDASPAYFDIFSLPKNGEAGGVASGVENYYSFDYGDIHFVCLGGYFSGSRLSNGLMCTWLKMDLEANTNKWLIAFWHQPPYTKGSHDSDAEFDHVEMRENAVPILESYGVDLVLAGHSHVYERSYLLRGHYGFSSSLQSSMILDDGFGRVDDTGPYVKQTTGPTAEHGTVYVVAGSSGWISGCCRGFHPAMRVMQPRIGSLVLDIDGDTLNGTFVNETGETDDYFTIVKNTTVVRIVDMSFENGAATLSWTSTVGHHYQVEYTADLTAAFVPLGNEIEATGPFTSNTYTTGGVQGFYRVVQTD